MTHSILTIIAPEDGRKIYFTDTRDECGRLVASEPFADLDAALAYAASL